MVSFECIERETLLKQRNDMMGCLLVPLRGSISSIEIPVYRFGSPSCRDSECSPDFSGASEEGQPLVDSLLLAKWEDLAWNGQLHYDVTSCPTRTIFGEKTLFIQLNENQKIEMAHDGSNRWSNPFELDIMNTLREDMLFCMERGDKNKPELVLSEPIPKDSILVIANKTPIEYGHVFLVPYHLPHPMHYRDSLESMILVAMEVRNKTFRIFYDQYATIRSGHTYYQACYFANWLPVERMPLTVLFDAPGDGISVCEIHGYPIRTLMLNSKMNLKLLAAVVSKTCSVLNEQNTIFNLLITDCGRKIFLFFQTQEADSHLSAWECGGHFVFNTPQEFDRANEDDIVQRMATASLDNACFQGMKQIICNIACKIVPSGHCA